MNRKLWAGFSEIGPIKGRIYPDFGEIGPLEGHHALATPPLDTPLLATPLLDTFSSHGQESAMNQTPAQQGKRVNQQLTSVLTSGCRSLRFRVLTRGAISRFPSPHVSRRCAVFAGSAATRLSVGAAGWPDRGRMRCSARRRDRPVDNVAEPAASQFGGGPKVRRSAGAGHRSRSAVVLGWLSGQRASGTTVSSGYSGRRAPTRRTPPRATVRQP